MSANIETSPLLSADAFTKLKLDTARRTNECLQATSDDNNAAFLTDLPPLDDWTARFHVKGNDELLFFFQKTLLDRKAEDLMKKMWENEHSMKSYRDASHVQPHVVQELGPDAYVFQRDLADETTHGRTVTTTYVRFRQPTENGDALALVTLGYQPADADVWAVKVCLWTEFVGTEDGGATVRMIGSTNLEGHTSTTSTIAAVVAGLRHWEAMNAAIQ